MPTLRLYFGCSQCTLSEAEAYIEISSGRFDYEDSSTDTDSYSRLGVRDEKTAVYQFISPRIILVISFPNSNTFSLYRAIPVNCFKKTMNFPVPILLL